MEPIVLQAATQALTGIESGCQFNGWTSLLGSMLIEEVRSPDTLKREIAEGQWENFNALCSLKEEDHAPNEELSTWLAEYTSEGEIGWLGQWAGRALAWTPHAAKCWEKSWHDLWLQREVAWHRRELSTPDPLLGSVAIIEAGLGSLLWKNSPLADKLTLWKRLVVASVFLWHRRPDRRMAVPERTILRCVAHAPFVFGTDLQDHVVHLVMLLGTREYLLTKLSQVLCQNGVTLPNVVRWFMNCEVELLELTEKEIDWANLTESKNVAELSKYRDDLASLISQG
jgi:hypothetical protein